MGDMIAYMIESGVEAASDNHQRFPSLPPLPVSPPHLLPSLIITIPRGQYSSFCTNKATKSSFAKNGFTQAVGLTK